MLVVVFRSVENITGHCSTRLHLWFYLFFTIHSFHCDSSASKVASGTYILALLFLPILLFLCSLLHVFYRPGSDCVTPRANSSKPAVYLHTVPENKASVGAATSDRLLASRPDINAGGSVFPRFNGSLFTRRACHATSKAAGSSGRDAAWKARARRRGGGAGGRRKREKQMKGPSGVGEVTMGWRCWDKHGRRNYTLQREPGEDIRFKLSFV